MCSRERPRRPTSSAPRSGIAGSMSPAAMRSAVRVSTPSGRRRLCAAPYAKSRPRPSSSGPSARSVLRRRVVPARATDSGSRTRTPHPSARDEANAIRSVVRPSDPSWQVWHVPRVDPPLRMRPARSWRWSLAVPWRDASVLEMMRPELSRTSTDPVDAALCDRRSARKRAPPASISPATRPDAWPVQSRIGTKSNTAGPFGPFTSPVALGRPARSASSAPGSTTASAAGTSGSLRRTRPSVSVR